VLVKPLFAYYFLISIPTKYVRSVFGHSVRFYVILYMLYI
jgi:hypothetical protein